MNVHRIYHRVDGVLVPTGHQVLGVDGAPIEAMIRSCDDLAKNAAKTSSFAAFAYKVDNRIEYYVSSAYYRWPNYPEESDGSRHPSMRSLRRDEKRTKKREDSAPRT